jgi:hypothetical protein
MLTTARPNGNWFSIEMMVAVFFTLDASKGPVGKPLASHPIVDDAEREATVLTRQDTN